MPVDTDTRLIRPDELAEWGRLRGAGRHRAAEDGSSWSTRARSTAGPHSGPRPAPGEMTTRLRPVGEETVKLTPSTPEAGTLLMPLPQRPPGINLDVARQQYPAPKRHAAQPAPALGDRFPLLGRLLRSLPRGGAL